MQRNNILSPLLAFIGTCLLPYQTMAQTNGGSSYSIFNIGDINTGSTAASVGRGGIEAGVPTPGIINSINPAGWGDLEYVTIQFGLNFQQYQVSDARGTVSQNNTKIQEFAVAFPYAKNNGGTIAFSLRPYSTVNYRTQLERDVPTIDSTTRGLINYNGHGGISRAQLGSSYSPAEWLTLGLAGNMYFGSITTTSSVTFANSTLNPATYDKFDRYVGYGATLGLVVQPSEDIRVGIAAETGGTLNRDRLERSTTIENNSRFIDTTETSESDLKLPIRLTAGVSAVTGRFGLALEGNTQLWSTDQFSTARNSMRVAAGVDRLPNPSVNATGFERWTFRFGGFFENTYYLLPGGGISHYGVTLGARYPITGTNALNASTAIDLGLEFGKRGTTANGLTEELYGRVTVGLAVSELWFVRRR